MPATPLHLGFALPIKLARGDKFSVPTFIWANCIMDIEPIAHILFELPGDLHGLTHTYLGAGLMTLACWVLMTLVYWWPEPRGKRVVESFAWGTVTHVLLDSFVHNDMNPLFPLMGNVFYFDGILSVSVIGFVLGALGLAFLTGSASVRQHLAQERLERVRAYFRELCGARHQ